MHTSPNTEVCAIFKRQPSSVRLKLSKMVGILLRKKHQYLPTEFPLANFTDELSLLSLARSGDFTSKGLVGFVRSRGRIYVFND